MSQSFPPLLENGCIAYILKGYPRTSETFITNEIRLLEQLGLDLRIFSVKKPQDQKQHAMVERIDVPVVYLPEASPLSENSFIPWLLENVPKFADSHWRLLKRKPLTFFSVFLESLILSVNYRTGALAPPRSVFFKEFLQAGFIAEAVLRMPDIRHLHAHFSHGSTTIAMLASRLCDIPFSFTAHAKDIYLRELNPGNLLQRKMRRAAFVVTCTGANEKHLKALAPNGTVIHRIYHGLDTKLFRTSEPFRKKNPETPLILSVGRLVEKKGFPYLIEACRILQKRGHRFRCRIVGGGDEKYSVQLKEMVVRDGLEGIIEFDGAVTQEELRKIYRRTDIFTLPCQVVANGDRDGIPNVLVEAMSMGVPVVSTAISGIPELIENEVNGLLVEEKNPEAMADALERLLLDPALRRALAQAGRERVCRNFDSERTTLALKDLFESQLQQHTALSHARI